MAIIDDRKFSPDEYADALKDIQKLNPDLSLEEIGDVLFRFQKIKSGTSQLVSLRNDPCCKGSEPSVVPRAGER